MILKITNTARDYAWGSHSLIPDYFGLPATGKPMAEVWFGTHDGSLATVVGHPEQTLLAAIGGKPLPFLLKILAAEAPLSIQAHPNSAQAQAGFARENAAGVPLSAFERNYKDDRHKPEMLVALTEFEALCGFLEIDAAFELLTSLQAVSKQLLAEQLGIWAQGIAENRNYASVFGLISSLNGEALVELQLQLESAFSNLGPDSEFAERGLMIAKLHALHPGDRGVLLALLMNHLWLRPNEAIFLPAGNIHAYLGGLGVEVMAASDNVLRGGLTPKHIDVPELEKVLDFSPCAEPRSVPKALATGLFEYPAAVDDFLLYRAELSGSTVMAELNLPASAIVLCTAGEISLSNSIAETQLLRRGEAAFIAKDAKSFSLAGSGTVFLATSAVS